jgi:translation initiation factor IF-3
VRLIDEEGKQLGIVLTRDALDIARERGLDLVEVQPNAAPPVCRLMDYGRFRYEESRKERESRRKSAIAVVKEVRIYPKIAEHDLVTKSRQAQRFLEQGDKVKVAVLFRGREMLHQEIGRTLLDRVVQELAPVSNVDQTAKMEGRTMSVFLSPKPEIRARLEAAKQPRDADDAELLPDEELAAGAEAPEPEAPEAPAG